MPISHLRKNSRQLSIYQMTHKVNNIANQPDFSICFRGFRVALTNDTWVSAEIDLFVPCRPALVVGSLAKIVIQFSNHTCARRTPWKRPTTPPTASFEVRIAGLFQRVIQQKHNLIEFRITFYILPSKLRARMNQ